MSDVAWACAACLLLYVLGYRVYGRYLARRVFRLDPTRTTPAHQLRDDVDYLPTRPSILFGHHYASITGLAPMLGPAVAVIWGWAPAMLWVVLGALFIGCVHDFAALVVSLRARGMSIGVVAEGIIGRRAKSLFHAVIFFGVALAMGVFIQAIAGLFRADHYPGAVLPSGGLMIVAAIMGWLLYVRRAPLLPVTVGGFVAMLALVWLGNATAGAITADAWPSDGQFRCVLLGYAFLASVLPVWSLLQPRDFVNSFLLYLGLVLMYAGLFAGRPEFSAPAFNPDPAGAPPLVPYVFIFVACGAASGFHALVSSGTTAKQLDRETHALTIGYGGMIGESLLGLIAVLACSAVGSTTAADWTSPDGAYADWAHANRPNQPLTTFIEGGARFIATVGLDLDLARSLVAVVAVSFALTTLDSAARLLSYNVQEIAASARATVLGGRVASSLVACAAIGFFAFSRYGLELWQLFGTVNQMLAGLTLLVVALYLYQRRRNWLVAALPAAFMLASTLVAMAQSLVEHVAAGSGLLAFVGALLFALAVWTVVEGLLAAARARREPPRTSDDVFADATDASEATLPRRH